MFFTYILKSILNKSYYIGSTDDIDERLKFHNEGKVRSTKRYLPWQLVKLEEFTTLKEARQRELQIKRWKSRAAIERLIRTL